MLVFFYLVLTLLNTE